MLTSWRERQTPGVPSTIQSSEYTADPGPVMQSQVNSDSFNFGVIPTSGQYMPSAGQSELVAPSFTPIVHSLCVSDCRETSKDRFYPKGTLCVTLPSTNQPKRRFRKDNHAHYKAMFANGETCTQEMEQLFSAMGDRSLTCFPVSEGVIFPANSSSEYIPLSVANHAEVRLDFLTDAIKTGLLVAHEKLVVRIKFETNQKIRATVDFQTGRVYDAETTRKIAEYNGKCDLALTGYQKTFEIGTIKETPLLNDEYIKVDVSSTFLQY